MASRALSPRRPVPRASARRRPADRAVLTRRRLLAAAVLLIVLYAGYMLWFRNLSWFAIDEVTLEGASTNEAQIKAAIDRVSGEMTTLHIKDGELRDAVARFPTVATVSASTSFPHALHVRVTERLPVAFISIGGRRTAISADGYLLTGANFDSKTVPPIEGAGARGPRLDGDGMAQAAILGATPKPLRDRIVSSNWDEDLGGVVLELDNGPEVRFGDGSRAADKWSAAVTVLSSTERGSPSYLDVSVPERPVSGA